MLKYRINCHTKINLQIIIPNVIKSALGDIYNVTSNISAVTCKTMSTNSSLLKTRHCSAIGRQELIPIKPPRQNPVTIHRQNSHPTFPPKMQYVVVINVYITSP